MDIISNLELWVLAASHKSLQWDNEIREGCFWLSGFIHYYVLPNDAHIFMSMQFDRIIDH